MKTIIIQTKPLEAFTTFRAWCKAKGQPYQSLSNIGLTPKVGRPVSINGVILHRIAIQ